MTDTRAAFHAYPKSKFPIRMLLFDPTGDLVFDTGEVKGFSAIEVPGLGPGGVRYSLALFGDGEAILNDDPTCSGTVEYAHDDLDVLGRLLHFIQIVQETGRWFAGNGSDMLNDLDDREELANIREFFEQQVSLGERFLGGLRSPGGCWKFRSLRRSDMSRDQIIQEMLEPCEDEPSKLEWLARWLDGVDAFIEQALEETVGHQVQDDLRRWARELRDGS